jgi:hypothetical protein
MRTASGTTQRSRWLRSVIAWMAFFGLALALGSVRGEELRTCVVDTAAVLPVTR